MEGGQVAFVTTTALDFAPVFGRDETRDLVAAALVADCQHYRAPLHAFAVMSNLAKLVLLLLNEAERAALAQLVGEGVLLCGP